MDRDQIDGVRFEKLAGQARLVLDSEPEKAAALLHTALSLSRQPARPRLLLGEALEQHGDRTHALAEFDVARAAFELLGGGFDLQRAARHLGTT